MLSHGPSADVARQIQGSAILRQIDDRVPRPPLALATLQEQLSAQVFPQVFVGMEPRLPTLTDPDPNALDTPGVRVAASATVRIEAPGCGGIQLGSGFAIGPDRILTNAHVVSGTRSVSIVVHGMPQPIAARVIAIDPARDVAIIGYPGGGPREVGAAVLNGHMLARGRDIYQERAVTRDIWVIEGHARPGNSGGPLVDAEGRYLGVVFAESISSPDQAYALSAAKVAPVIAQSEGRTDAIDTRAYPCTS